MEELQDPRVTVPGIIRIYTWCLSSFPELILRYNYILPPLLSDCPQECVRRQIYVSAIEECQFPHFAVFLTLGVLRLP
jgi:hypothetical protein